MARIAVTIHACDIKVMGNDNTSQEDYTIFSEEESINTDAILVEQLEDFLVELIVEKELQESIKTETDGIEPPESAI